MAANPLVRKLNGLAGLPLHEAEAFNSLCAERVRVVAAKRNIICDGDVPGEVHLIVEGWAARYKLLPDGGRQITALLIPGDFCDLHVTVLKKMDHGIIALTACKVAYINSEKFDRFTSEHPAITKALWWMTLVDEAVLREWIVNIGRRTATEAVAHLLCELQQRLNAVGLIDDVSFDLPLTQEEIADSLGMTPVHINRVLQRLRAAGLIQWTKQRLTILDSDRLRSLGGFDGGYLHMRAARPAKLLKPVGEKRATPWPVLES